MNQRGGGGGYSKWMIDMRMESSKQQATIIVIIHHFHSFCVFALFNANHQYLLICIQFALHPFIACFWHIFPQSIHIV